MQKYINYESVKFDISEIENFKLFRHGNDALFWYNGEVEIMASPEWDESEGKCPIQIASDDDISDGFSFDLGHPYDLEKQKQRYLDIIGEVIAKVNSGRYESFDDLLKSIKSINQ